MSENVLPFLDRFKHPIFKNSSFFFITFNFDVIYPLIVSTIYPKYYEPMQEVENVIKTIESDYCTRVILPLILGFVIAAILPVIDAGYRWFGAFMDRKRENWVSKEEEKIYQRKINLLSSKLNSVIGFIEDSEKRGIFRDVSDNSILYLFPCESNLTEATWVKYDTSKKKIYPASKEDSNLLGVVLKVINNDVALILNAGQLNDPSFLRIKDDGKYIVSDGGGIEKVHSGYPNAPIEKIENQVTIVKRGNLGLAKFIDRER